MSDVRSYRSDAERLNLRMLEQVIGYQFVNIELLQMAITTPAFRGEHMAGAVCDNQRLEFLGDAIIGLVSAHHLYVAFPHDDEGQLTQRRNRLTRGETLSHLAAQIKLHRFLRMGRNEDGVHQPGSARLLADALEAIFGALWLDGGWEAALQFYEQLIELQDTTALLALDENPKGVLQEYCQARGWQNYPQYEVVGVTGADHAPNYEVMVTLPAGRCVVAQGGSKKMAEAAAAQLMWQLLARDQTRGVLESP